MGKATEGARVKRRIQRVVVLTHGNPAVAAEELRQSLSFLAAHGVGVAAPPAEWDKHAEILSASGVVSRVVEQTDLRDVDLCLVLGGDGTMLRGFHLTRDLNVPVAGVNLGRVGFLTTVLSDRLEEGLAALLAGQFTEHALLGLRAALGPSTFRAANDVVVGRGDRSDASSLALRINGVTLFEVLCDGVVVGTPAGSSAYSLAAGGPLLGISVDAYVISLVAPHAVGVRPVVAAPCDVLEIANMSSREDCSVDVDGQRSGAIPPGGVMEIMTEPGVACLALLAGDSLYHHFRDRLL
jgi:NAD+ kinase